MVMILMFYRRRASPKHRYNIIEEDYGEGGAPHTAKRTILEINLCVYGVPPAPVYKGVEEERAGPLYGAPWGVLLPPEVGFPPPSM